MCVWLTVADLSPGRFWGPMVGPLQRRGRCTPLLLNLLLLVYPPMAEEWTGAPLGLIGSLEPGEEKEGHLRLEE